MRTRTKVALVAAAVAGTTVAVRARRRPAPDLADHDRAAHAEQADGERWIVSHDGAELVVTTTGPEDGPVVVLAHCWTGSQRTWAPVARRLEAAGCRVVRWDQRGHGRSRPGHKGHSIEGLADDLASVVDQLDLRDVVLVGHSMGGMTVEAFATHHHALFHDRTRAVVLVATAAHSLANPANRRAPELLASSLVERALERPSTGRLLMRSTFGRRAHPHHVAATHQDWVATAPAVRIDFLTAMQAMDLRDGIARIDVPTTILCGSRDTLTPLPLSRALAATIPGSHLEVLPGFGHMLPYEAPDAVADAVLAHVGTARPAVRR